MKCKFYHPERANQSQLSVADELRALRDKAKTFSPKSSLQDTHCCPAVYQPDHRYTSSTPPPLSIEDQSHRVSPSEQFIFQRDTSSPRMQPNTSLGHCPSPDVDEAFGSLDSMSRLYIHDGPPHSYSSGVASYSLSHDECSLSGSYGGNNQRTSLGGGSYYPPPNGSVSCEHHMCTQCRCSHPQSRVSPHSSAWGSCPALLPYNGDHSSHFSEKQYFSLHTHRQTHSLPRDLWAQSSFPRAKSPSSEQRKGLRSQLSTLFPQSVVEQVMNAYPHVSDMSKLSSLMQSYRNSHISY